MFWLLMGLGAAYSIGKNSGSGKCSSKNTNIERKSIEHSKKKAMETEHKWKSDLRGIDWIASESDIHNGPICVKCGYTYCMHCDSPRIKCKGHK